MTHDDIIRLARQASEVGSMWWRSRDTLERFAALVAAEKDEEIAALKQERRRDMAEINSLREAEESLREEVERLREALTVVAKAELYDPATGIIDAEVLETVQDVARSALRREQV